MSMSIESVMHEHEPELLQIPGVTGVGIGEERGQQIIIVFVKKQLSEDALPSSQPIPTTLEGYTVDVREELEVG